MNGVYDTHAEMITGVLAVAAEIAARSPLAVWGSKEMITYARDHSVADGLNYIATWQTGMFQPADMTEAFVARAEKRDARTTTSSRCGEGSSNDHGQSSSLWSAGR